MTPLKPTSRKCTSWTRALTPQRPSRDTSRHCPGNHWMRDASRGRPGKRWMKENHWMKEKPLDERETTGRKTRKWFEKSRGRAVNILSLRGRACQFGFEPTRRSYSFQPSWENVYSSADSALTKDCYYNWTSALKVGYPVLKTNRLFKLNSNIWLNSRIILLFI